jgi:hypothetical protein
LQQLEADDEKRLELALERMQAAFADVDESQLESDVAMVIDRVRRANRGGSNPQDLA